MRSTRSPVSTSLWYVSMIGRPAPTVASYLTLRAAVADGAEQRRRSAPTSRPAASCWRARRRSRGRARSRSRSPVSSLVTSTTTGRDTAWPAMNVSASARGRRRAAERREQRAGVLLARQVEQPAAREAARLEDVAGAIEQADDAHRRLCRSARRSDRRARGRRGRSRAARRRCAASAAAPSAADLRELKRRVDAARRLGGIVAVDDERDVALGRSLRDRDDVDAAAASAENTRAAMPGVPAMPSPTTATHRHARPRRDAVDEAAGELVAERLPEARDRAVGLGLRQREADRALGRGLEDRRDREPLGVDRRRTCARRCRARRPCPCRRR